MYALYPTPITPQRLPLFDAGGHLKMPYVNSFHETLQPVFFSKKRD